MKGKGTLLTGISMLSWLAQSGIACAADTHRVYTSGILVLLFVGVCALVVTVQLIPALMTLWGMLKEAMAGANKEAKAESHE